MTTNELEKLRDAAQDQIGEILKNLKMETEMNVEINVQSTEVGWKGIPMYSVKLKLTL